MQKLTLDQWQTIRAKREAGASFKSLGDEFSVSYQLIQRRAKKEGWSDGSDIEDAIQRKTSEKLAGVVTNNPKKKAEAIDEEAEKRATIGIPSIKACGEVILPGNNAHIKNCAGPKHLSDLAFKELARNHARELIISQIDTNPVSPGIDQSQSGWICSLSVATWDSRAIVSEAIRALLRQIDLFNTEAFDPAESDKLIQTVDRINRRYPKGISLAATGFEQSWKTKAERLSKRYTTDWWELVEVRNPPAEKTSPTFSY
jgi:hypothetical protein